MPPMEGHQEKIEYTEWYKKSTGKGLWSGKDTEVSQGDRKVWRIINIRSS